MKTKEISTRELAVKWWNDESNLLNRTALFNRYFSNTATKDKMFTVANNYEELTGREIEEIWKNEVLEPKRQKEWQESQVNCKYTKPNAKEFDESLFRAYIDKLPKSETLNMIKIIYENKLPDCKFKAHLDKWFKL